MKAAIYIWMLSVLAVSARAAPREVGDVKWERDFEAATALAGEQNKPLLILFQEIPGCSTCVNYGQNVLRHPLLVEAIEILFVPLVVHNNKGGQDAKVLARFGEPSWNNPVVRIVDSHHKLIVPRVSGN
jgi:hypothetical protein